MLMNCHRMKIIKKCLAFQLQRQLWVELFWVGLSVPGFICLKKTRDRTSKRVGFSRS